MKINISGLDTLQRDLKNAERALSSLNGTFATLKFDPTDPNGVQAAIREMERAVDSKVSQYARNPIVAPLIEAAKKHYRDEIKKLSTKSSSTSFPHSLL